MLARNARAAARVMSFSVSLPRAQSLAMRSLRARVESRQAASPTSLRSAEASRGRPRRASTRPKYFRRLAQTFLGKQPHERIGRVGRQRIDTELDEAEHRLAFERLGQAVGVHAQARRVRGAAQLTRHPVPANVQRGDPRNGPLPLVVRSSVSSCSRTGTPSAVRCTSNSTSSAPSFSPRASDAIVFSGACAAAPRWPTTRTPIGGGYRPLEANAPRDWPVT